MTEGGVWTTRHGQAEMAVRQVTQETLHGALAQLISNGEVASAPLEDVLACARDFLEEFDKPDLVVVIKRCGNDECPQSVFKFAPQPHDTWEDGCWTCGEQLVDTEES